MAASEYVNAGLDSVKKFWQEFDIKKWSEQIGGSSAEAVEAAIYFCLSFAVGFLFKKYFKFIFACLFTALILIIILDYGQFLTIDWNAIKAFFGIGAATDVNTVLNQFFDWIKNHILLFIAIVVGFLVGYKLG